MTKAPLGGKKTHPNSTDRGKTGTKRSLLTDGRGLPLALAGANVIDFKLLEQTLAAIEASRPAPTPTQPQHLYLDKGYDYDGPRQIAYDYGFIAHNRRGEDRSQTPAHPGKIWCAGTQRAAQQKARSNLRSHAPHRPRRHSLGVRLPTGIGFKLRAYH